MSTFYWGSQSLDHAGELRLSDRATSHWYLIHTQNIKQYAIPTCPAVTIASSQLSQLPGHTLPFSHLKTDPGTIPPEDQKTSVSFWYILQHSYLTSTAKCDRGAAAL